MQKRRILIVSASFYPTISPRSLRTTELAKEFARQGHEVVVYIPENGYDYSEFILKYPIQINYLGRLQFKQIQLKGKGFEILIRRVIRRVTRLLFEYPNIELMFKVSKHLRSESGFDILISIAAPHPIHWGVAKIWSGKNKPAEIWIADCGDPYMGITADTFRKMFYFKYVEKWFSRKADYISIPYKGGISGYYPEFQDKIRIIPQGFDLYTLNLPEYKKTINYPIFAYAGSLFPGQHDPRPLMDFLSDFKSEFRFILYTRETSMILPYKEKMGKKLIIRDYIPREELLGILAGMDFLINFGYSTGTQLPHKLIDYAISGRPVLNISTEPDFSILQEFMDGNYSGRLNLASPDDYDIRKVTGSFLQLHRQS